MKPRQFVRWAVSAGLVGGIAQPSPAQTPPAPAAAPAAPTPVAWKRAGTIQPPEQPPAVPASVPAPIPPPTLTVVPVAATGSTGSASPVGEPKAPPKPAAAGGFPQWRLPANRPRPAPPPARMNFMPQPLPAVRTSRGQEPDEPEVILQPATPAPPGTTPPAATPPGPGGAAPGGAAPGGAGAGGLAPGAATGQPSVGTGLGGAVPPSGTPDAKKFHGHRYPIQPFAPPGASPVPPTDAGYYTLAALVKGEEQAKPPRWPYPRGGPFPMPFNEVDFSYLDAIPMADRDIAERLHRVPVGDHWLFSTGGEIRLRNNDETNTRLTGRDDIYGLLRNRVYTDVWYEDTFRLYSEFLYGDSVWQDVAPYPRDVNRGDIQQLFVDVKLGEIDKNPIYFRGGRQELLYGSQRLVSTNDWGNARNRFDGVKAFYRSPKLDVDAFVTRPTITKGADLDTWDTRQTFSGLWATYRPKKGTIVDAYYLNLDNNNTNVARGQRRSGGFNVSTFGGRYYARHDSGLLTDFEGMLQFGHYADQSVLAQAFHGYLGWYFKDVWATPTVWAGYDYASGDPDPNNTGQRRTFNQLFQFGHYYYGFTDVNGGQNMRDYNIQAYAYPAHWITLGTQFHVFRLDSNKDALYGQAGQVVRQDRTGRAGNDVGTELDILANFHLTDRQDIFFNYHHLYTGSFIRSTGPGVRGVPLDYTYLQYSLRW